MSSPRLPDRAQWVAPADFNIYQVAALRQELLETLQQDLPVECDLAAVEDLDSAGIQLLLAAQRACTAAGHALTLRAASPASCEALGVVGLDPVTLADLHPAIPASSQEVAA